MQAVKFEGNGTEYFKIWIVNILLTILTIGLYYPWAKVRNKRYFYANTTLEGRSFEYHATGKQLLVGYLIAMTLLIVYIGVQKVSPIGSLIVLLVFFAGLPWIVWRSLKFNARMTSFSNVRFGFDGTLGQSYVNFFLYPLMFFIVIYAPTITIALLSPNSGGLIGFAMLVSMGFGIYMFGWLKEKNLTYMIGGLRYGQGAFGTKYEAGSFATIGLMTVIVFSIAMIVIMFAAGIISVSAIGVENLAALKEKGTGSEEETAERLRTILPLIASVYLGMIVASLISFAHWTAKYREYLFANTTLDGTVAFASTLKFSTALWVLLSNLLLVIVTAGLAYPWAKVRWTKMSVESIQAEASEGFDTYMTQKHTEESSLGEQIGDAFDVDVGIGF